MTLAKRYQAFLDHFVRHQPAPTTELVYANDFELLVAIVLSAQCRDERINRVTPALFARFPTPLALSKATQQEVYELIRTVSFPHNKAKYVRRLSEMLATTYEGSVPQDVDALQKLPGVGRKTAHVFLATFYDVPALGIDTHVFRVAKRLGLVGPDAKTTLAVEKELLKHLPEKYVSRVNHWLVLHGRYLCKARKPRCMECPLTEACAFFQEGRGSRIRDL